MPNAVNDLFARRRERFFDRVREGVAVLFATPEQHLSWDGTYRYRPDPDLFYLTGFGEPETVAVLDASARSFFLFVRPRDREKETWNGRRAGTKGAVKVHGADEAWPVEELEKPKSTSSGGNAHTGRRRLMSARSGTKAALKERDLQLGSARSSE